MARSRTYSDDELGRAVSGAHSWRGVLRDLGLAGTSGGSLRSVRAQADRLGLHYGHFSGQRKWSDHELAQAVAGAISWTEVVEKLGLTGSARLALVRGHSARLGLDVAHLPSSTSAVHVTDRRPDSRNLDRAGPMLAAAWFTLCGCDVSWPLEPSRYDLLVIDDGAMRRVQVKTTTTCSGSSWKVYLSTTRGERRPYSSDEIDCFFVIDGDLNYYLIPLDVVGGLHAIHLRSYERFRLKTTISQDDTAAQV